MQWLINGRTFRLEPENPETKKRMEKAFSVMEQEEKQILSDYCAMFRKLFAGIFGEKKARQIFQSLPENPRIYNEIFLSFLRAVQASRLENGKKTKKHKKHKRKRKC
ncbi:MAG: hypothetical protein IJJ69_14110 [Oscillospiraceae bacterium]|nr:hypothetical protein [Oscillospiraceae bacterium]